MKKLISLVLMCFLTLTAHANIVLNGSFEDVGLASGQQTQTEGTWDVYQVLPGWKTFEGRGIEVRNHVAGRASMGFNFVELDSYSNSGMIQELATNVSVTYRLSFDYSPRAGVPLHSNGIEVWWNNDILDVIFRDGFLLSNQLWTTFSYDVVGTGFDSLKFRAVGTNDSLGASLDNVSVVTEPSTLFLMLAGLLLVFFQKYKKIKG